MAAMASCLVALGCALVRRQWNNVNPLIRTKQIHLKHVLVVGQTNGFEHDSVSAAMDFVYRMGHETGLWIRVMRTDTELLTKKKFTNNGKNLDYLTASSLPAPPAS